MLGLVGNHRRAACVGSLMSNPVDIDAAAAQLMNKWNALLGQALGPSARGRQDIPEALRALIVSDRKRFRTFVRRPLFWANPWHQELMAKWAAKYKLRARQVAEALPRGEALSAKAQPAPLPLRDDILPGGASVATWAALALGTYLFLDKR